MPAGPNRFLRLFEQSGVAQALISRDGRITAINQAAATLFGRQPAEVAGQPLLPRLPEEDPDGDEQMLHDLLSGKLEQAHFERRLVRQDGSSIDALISCAGIRSGSGVEEISVCLQDISELTAAKFAAERAEARWRSLSQNASDVALIVDRELTVTYASPALTELLGYPEDHLAGRPLPSLAHPDDVERVASVMRRLVATGIRDLQVELRMRHVSGAWRRVEQRILNLLHDPHVTGLVVNVRDVTERHELQTSLLRASLEDPLTRLPNHALLMDRIEQAVAGELSGGDSYSLLIVNIDRLAALNDVFGHAAGNEVLCAVADNLCALVRPSDTVARYAGDEFAVLVSHPTDDPEQATTLAERIAASLNTELARGRQPNIHYSACVGVAHGPAETAESLVSAAAAATARAKELGRGNWHVLEDTARDQAAEQRALAAELASAIEANRLSVHFQPIVALATGAIAGFEALVRWDHSERGLLAPSSFLHLADALDLQRRIDERILGEACQVAKTWPSGLDGPLSVSVNVAPAHLTSAGFVISVCRALEASQLPPAQLILEVTENAVVADVARAEEVLTTLAGLGVRVAIDDFGTGYSSMLQLRRLPFHKLKIDREFVRELPASADDTAICASVISLAAKLEVQVIAEGIEDPEQAAVLHSLGCRYGQGFLWSAAVPAEETRAMLAEPPWRVALPAVSPRRAARVLPAVPPEVLSHARRLHESGASLHTIAASLNRSHPAGNGSRRWHPSTVARLLYQTRPST